MVGCRKKAQVKYTVSLLLLLRALGRPGTRKRLGREGVLTNTCHQAKMYDIVTYHMYYRHVSHFRHLFRIFAPLYLLNHGVFWSDIWTQYSFLQFRKIILMPKWRNRSLTAMMCKLSNVISNHHNKPKTADFLRLGGPKHDTCWY